jgi:transposase
MSQVPKKEMVKEHSEDLRRSIIRAYNSGKSNKEIATLFHCDRTTSYRVVMAYGREGRISVKPKYGGRRRKTDEAEQTMTPFWVY